MIQVYFGNNKSKGHENNNHNHQNHIDTVGNTSLINQSWILVFLAQDEILKDTGKSCRNPLLPHSITNIITLSQNQATIVSPIKITSIYCIIQIDLCS